MPSALYLLQREIEKSPKNLGGIPLNCIPSLEDPRDFKYPKLLAAQGVKAEPAGIIDYRKNLPPVFNQGKRGSCVAAACAWTMKAYQEMTEGRYPTGGLSAAYLYTMCKQLDGIPGEEGTYPRTAMQVLQKHGVCTEEWMPYWTLANLPAPKVPTVPALADARAEPYKIKAYARICAPEDKDTDRSGLLTTIRQALAREGPFVLALLVCSNFKPDADGRLPLPKGFVLGGHLVGIAGDMPGEKALILRNTWGPEWGQDGYALLPYEWLTRSSDTVRYVFEAWTSVDVVMPKAASKIEIAPGATSMRVDGQYVQLDQPAFITEQDRLVLPIRAIGGNMGYEVQWDGTKAILTLPKLN